MIIRVKPIKDAFTFGGLVKKNSGLDEILELGHSDLLGTEGSSRIFMSFSVKKPADWNEVEHRATLNLFEVRSENVPNPCEIEIYTFKSDWTEGLGHISDVPDTEKGLSRRTEPEGLELLGKVVFTKADDCLDLKIDITRLIDEQDSTINLMLKLADESIADSLGTRIMYYSSDTHTCSWPYIDLEYDDSVQNSELEEVPEGTTYGIVDEYTGEAVVSAENNLGTIVSSDNSGSFIMLQTDMLEPERYYRLVFSLATRESCKHCLYEDVRRTFRVGRLWKTR